VIRTEPKPSVTPIPRSLESLYHINAVIYIYIYMYLIGGMAEMRSTL